MAIQWRLGVVGTNGWKTVSLDYSGGSTAYIIVKPSKENTSWKFELYDSCISDSEELGDEYYANTATTSSVFPKPSKSVCENNGGYWNDDNECEASLYSAINICNMPTIEQWRAVISLCEGKLNHYDDNSNNSSYRACIQKLGYMANSYWSTSSYNGSSQAWGVDLAYGADFGTLPNINYSYFVRCSN